jgi:hypothetical protein
VAADEDGTQRRQVGAYPVVRFVGDGAAASVYVCTDTVSPPPEQGREVAVKVLHPALVQPASRRARLNLLVERLRSIPSPYVARFIDINDGDGDAGEVFVVVDLLPGEDLQTCVLRDGRIPIKEALRYARDASKGLRAAAAVGVTHGDVRPANLVVDGRRLKIADFGLGLPLSAVRTQQAKAGRSGLLGTTAAYLAPERIARGDVDGDSGIAADDISAGVVADVYALGCTLFALLTGRPPFAIESVSELLRAHTTEAPPSLLGHLPQAPPTLMNLMDALLAKDPARRPQRHDDVVALIEAALEDVIASPAAAVGLAPSAAPQKGPAAGPPAGPASGPAQKRIQASATPAPVPFDDPFAAPPSDQNIVMGAPTGVVGGLKQMNVVEIVQGLELGRKTAVVDVHPSHGDKGLIACRGGRVVYAECGAARGEAAFYALIGHGDGYFRIHYGDAPFDANIQAPTQFLMLEALRRIDEGAEADGGAPDTTDSGAARTPFSSAERSDPFGALPPTEASSAPRIRPAATPLDRVVQDFDAPTEALSTGHDKTHGAASDDGDDDGTVPGVTAPTAPTAAGGAPSVDELINDLLELAGGLRRGISGGWSGVVDGAYRAVGAPAALAGAHQFGRTVPGLGAALGVVVVLVVVLVGVVGGGDFDPAAADRDIDAGRAAAVLADIDDVDEGERSGLQHLWRGHALMALSAPAPAPVQAMTSYVAAARAGVVDERALGAVLAALSDDGATLALDALAAWPDAGVDDRLRALLIDQKFTARQQARMALQERRSFSTADAERIGITDLTHGRTCAERRMGLELLVDKGVSDAVVDALEIAAGNSDIIGCLGRELAAGARAVADRRKLQAPD